MSIRNNNLLDLWLAAARLDRDTVRRIISELDDLRSRIDDAQQEERELHDIETPQLRWPHYDVPAEK